jgi:hypothetical protein
MSGQCSKQLRGAAGMTDQEVVNQAMRGFRTCALSPRLPAEQGNSEFKESPAARELARVDYCR